MMTAATSFGFESIGTWLVSNSVVVAFMRFAKKRSSSGAIAWSFLATMYQDGFVFHATLDTLVAKAEAIIGPCVAADSSWRYHRRPHPNLVLAQLYRARLINAPPRESPIPAEPIPQRS